jgi:hypothetical protein
MFEDQIKTLLKHISDLQQAEPFIVYENLKDYI